MKKLDVSNLKSVTDFIAFFDAIPAAKWCTGSFNNGHGKCCALGHLGRGKYTDTEITSKANVASGRLNSLIGGSITSVNDGNNFSSYGVNYLELGETPKERVINYLTLVANGLHNNKFR